MALSCLNPPSFKKSGGLKEWMDRYCWVLDSKYMFGSVIEIVFHESDVVR